MKSTGEVMGLDTSFERAFAKAQLGAGVKLPDAGQVFLSVSDARQGGRWSPWRAGWSTWASPSWPRAAPRRALREAGLPVDAVNKVLEGRPHCVDAIRSGEVQLVINTASGAAIRGR